MRHLFQSAPDPRARVNFTRLQPVGLTSAPSPTRDPLLAPVDCARYPPPLSAPHQPVDYAMSALLTIDRKFDQVHYDLFSRLYSIFIVCFSIRNLDMPGNGISCLIHVIFMEIILFSGLKPCTVISKAASCDFTSLVTVLFQKKWTKKPILPMPFILRIGKVLIIRSSLCFVIHLFHPLLMSLTTLILPKKFGTYLLLGMLDRVMLATSSSHANFIRFVKNQVSGLMCITAG